MLTVNSRNDAQKYSGPKKQKLILMLTVNSRKDAQKYSGPKTLLAM